MDTIDIISNIDSRVYNTLDNKLECIVRLKNGLKLTAETDLRFKTNVFGYDVIDPEVKFECFEKAINSYSNS